MEMWQWLLLFWVFKAAAKNFFDAGALFNLLKRDPVCVLSSF